jgi:predicted unusual protein kinase regulating ubiquinone biosynthesis (AarF/ABC1/UbiB family)
VDEWGRRFVDELDYVQEAANGERFRLAMESRPDLAGVVTAPPVERGASTRRVLTTGRGHAMSWMTRRTPVHHVVDDTARYANLCA